LPPKYVRGRLQDAVGAVAEVDRVEVGGEDPVLRPPLRELPGERGFAHLARNRLVVAAVGVLHVLLRDGRAALDDRLVADVLPGGTEDAADVDAVVLEEPLVLRATIACFMIGAISSDLTSTRLSSPRRIASTRRWPDLFGAE
jgi:hypothetical protein